MGHQVNFYASPPDIANLQRLLGEMEPMLILHSRAASANPRVLSSLRHAEHGDPWLFYYLVRKSDLEDVILEHVAEQRYWSIDVIRSPVVQFNSCFFDGTILRRGRVYYVDGFYGENGEWIEKSEGFRLWARAILKVTKKGLKRHGSDYIGAGAAEWLVGGGVKLVI